LIAGSWNELVSSRLYQIANAVAIAVENRKTVAAPIDEQEKVAGNRILRKGGYNQARERIKAFAEIRWR
jgi:hypothetical protein